MRVLHIVILSATLVLAACATQAAENANDVDDRLARKITYSGYKRLHVVTDDLSKMTGVTIHCGKNNSDWQARDIPVTINVKDMSLNKVLMALAEVCHLTVSSRKPDEIVNVWTYRLSRNKKGKDDLERYINKQIEDASDAWDAAVRFAGVPDSALKGSPEVVEELKKDRLIGKILAALEPDAKDRVFTGDSIILNGKSSRQSDLIRELYLYAWKNPTISSMEINGKPYPLYKNAHDPTSEEMEQACLTIQLTDNVGNITIRLFPVIKGFEVIDWISPVEISAEGHAILGEDQESLPVPLGSDVLSLVEETEAQRDCSDSRLRFLTRKEDWNLPALQMELKIELPKDKKGLASADYLIALSKAAGFNLICEDFISHQNYIGDAPKIEPEKKTKFGNGLREARFNWWSVSERDKLIIGWANDWRKCHMNLVPEALLNDLRDKLGKKGLYLDDVTPLFNLLPGQIDEWLTNSRDLDELSDVDVSGERVFWQLYDQLPQDCKKLAKTGTGLPMERLDAVWLRDFFRERRRETTNDSGFSLNTYADMNARKTYIKNALLITEAMSSPTFLSTMTMRIIAKNEEGKLTYSMKLSGVKDEQAFEINAGGPGAAFPILSKKRAEEQRKVSPDSVGKD
ncbi:MAG: hypothetical protein Q7N50_00905 [Armatimonadota bacterium]|nr:hypothetical protein [Armatimonadota bacterium]